MNQPEQPKREVCGVEYVDDLNCRARCIREKGHDGPHMDGFALWWEGRKGHP